MNLVATTQRVVLDPRTGERRDALDQRWTTFLDACGLIPLIMPNCLGTVQQLLHELPVRGILLTGGNDLTAYGGDAPERDEIESWLLDESMRRGLPLLGVCRGMQLIQHRLGVALTRITGHVAVRFDVEFAGRARAINSYHCFGTCENAPELEILCRSADGVVKAIRHRTERVAGIMWHPEREPEFDHGDMEFVRQWFVGRETS